MITCINAPFNDFSNQQSVTQPNACSHSGDVSKTV